VSNCECRVSNERSAKTQVDTRHFEFGTVKGGSMRSMQSKDSLVSYRRRGSSAAAQSTISRSKWTDVVVVEQGPCLKRLGQHRMRRASSFRPKVEDAVPAFAVDVGL